MLRAIAGIALLLACRERAQPASAAKADPAKMADPAPVAGEGRVIDLTTNGAGGAGPSEAPREVESRVGDDHCSEMYTACLQDAKREPCTSARLRIECGEVARIPATRELLRCVCRESVLRRHLSRVRPGSWPRCDRARSQPPGGPIVGTRARARWMPVAGIAHVGLSTR